MTSRFVAPYCPIHLDKDQICAGHACGAAVRVADGWICGLASSAHGMPRLVEQQPRKAIPFYGHMNDVD